MTSVQSVDSILTGYLNTNEEAIKSLKTEAAKSKTQFIALQNLVLLRHLIENAKIAFAEYNEENLDKLSPPNKEIVDAIGLLIKQKNQLNLEERIHQLRGKLPFDEKRPFLWATLPCLIFRNNEDPIQLKLIGHFENLVDLIFKLNGKEHTVNLVSSNELSCALLPSDAFANMDLSQAKQILFSEGELQIPWKFHLKNDLRITSLFKVTLAAIPSTPGKITLTYKTRERRTQNVFRDLRLTKCSVTICSRKCCGNDDQPERKGYRHFSASADAGWLIDPATAQVLVTGADGVRSGPHNIRVHQNTVTWDARTVHKVAGTSGWFSFRAVFQQYQDVDRTFTPSIDLQWGNSHKQNFDYTLLEWKAKIEGFDGKSYEYDATHSQHTDFPYLSVERKGNTFEFKTKLIEELKDI